MRSLVRGGGFDFSVKVYPGGGNYDVKSMHLSLYIHIQIYTYIYIYIYIYYVVFKEFRR